MSRNLPGNHFIGYNVVNLQSGNFTTDTEYVTATSHLLHAGLLRYPGGNLADWWNWETGWCVKTTTASGCPRCKNPCARKSTVRTYTLEEFQIVVKASSALPVLMINMLTLTLDSQLKYLAHAQALGLLGEGTYVELGGEFYWGKYSGRWSTGKEYANEANIWAKAIKANYPSVRIMVVAAHSTANQAPTDRGYTWNGFVYSTVDTSVVDGVTLHPYLHLDNPTGGAAPLQPGVPPRGKDDGPTGWYNSTKVQQDNVNFLRSDKGIEAVLGVPFFVATSAVGNMATHQPLPSDLRMIITETNMMERAGPIKLSWLHGLFMASTFFNLLSIRQVDGILLHVLLNGYGWGALYETDSDFHGPFGGIPPSGSMDTALGKVGCLVPACATITTKSYMPTAVGVALGALAGSMHGATEAMQIDFNGTTNPSRVGALPSGLNGTMVYPSLFGFIFSSAEQQEQNATVMNFNSISLEYKWEVGLSPCSSYTHWTTPDVIHGRPLAWVSTTANVNVTTVQCVNDGDDVGGDGGGGGGGSVTLPPYSITTVRFQSMLVEMEDEGGGGGGG